MRQPIVIYPSKWKLLATAIGSLIFIVLQIVFVIYGDVLTAGDTSLRGQLVHLIITYLPYIGIPFFLLCGIYAFYRLLSPKPSVIINHEGIFDNASAAGAGLIKWEEIAELFTYQFMNQRFLGIVPLNTEAVMQRQSFSKRLLMKVNKRMVEAPFNIPQNTLPMTVEELLQQAIEFRRQLLSSNSFVAATPPPPHSEPKLVR